MEIGTQDIDVMAATSASRMAYHAQKKAMPIGKIEESAKDFESVFMSQMIKPMWDTVETDPDFGGGPGEDVMRDMLVQEYGKSMASVDNYKLAKSVMDVMITIQNKAGNGVDYTGAAA